MGGVVMDATDVGQNSPVANAKTTKSRRKSVPNSPGRKTHDEVQENGMVEILRKMATAEDTPVFDAVEACMSLFFAEPLLAPDIRNEALTQLKVFARRPENRQIIYRSGRLAFLVPHLLDRTVTEGLAALMINMFFHVPGRVLDDIGVPQSMYVEYLVHHRVCPKMVAAISKVGPGAHRTTQLLLMGLCNLTSHGQEYKDEICKCPGMASMLSTSLLATDPLVSSNAAKLINALCCQDTCLSPERVTAVSDGGVPAAVSALFLDRRPEATNVAVSLVPVLFSIFQQSHVRFCRNFLTNGGDVGIRRLTEALTTRLGRPKKGYDLVCKQLSGIRWWQEAFSKPMTPLLRALIILNRKRGSPSSYMGLKKVLVSEFGEDAFLAVRSEVQDLLAKRHKQFELEVTGMKAHRPVLDTSKGSPSGSISPPFSRQESPEAPPGIRDGEPLATAVEKDPDCVRAWEARQLDSLRSAVSNILDDVFQQATFTAMVLTAPQTSADREWSDSDSSSSSGESEDDYATPLKSPFNSPRRA